MIWIILIYVISCVLLLNIMIKEVKDEGLTPSYDNLFEYYQFNLIWVICPIINLIIVTLWYVIKIIDKINSCCH